MSLLKIDISINSHGGWVFTHVISKTGANTKCQTWHRNVPR